ncbi:MAG: ABC transporter permease subunit [Ignavibacteria bacterium]|nr:ABC transporter permease subunit [Ignavibacteria bacterium]
MNIFLREIKAYRGSTLVWILSLCTLATMFLFMFPAFSKDVDATRAIMANLPAAVRDALDISLANFFTIYGFFAYIFTFATLAGAVQAMNLGVGIMSKEDSVKTVDFLLTKPISRFKVFVSKFLASFGLILITNFIFSSVSYSVASIVSMDGLDIQIFSLILASFFLIQLFFLALGILISMLINKIRSPITVTLPTVFGFFIIGMLGSIIGNDNVRYICPFKFYDLNYVINKGAYEMNYLYVELVVVFIAIIASYLIYSRKDIKAAS